MCAKPLRYLREGRIIVFDIEVQSDADGNRTRHMEHYWLCGLCAQSFTLARTPEGLRLVRLAAAEREHRQSGPSYS
jgi:hypothetical protein